MPLLALCVLAAARIAAGGLEGGRKISSGNYSDRFRELLGMGGSGTVPGYSYYIPELWNNSGGGWTRTRPGGGGFSTIPESPPLANIGFALFSQALFRQSDRLRLTEFLRAINFKTTDRLKPAELLVMFRVWAPRSGLSAGAKFMARSDEHSAQIAGMIADAAAHWDGSVRDESGRRLAQIRIRLTFRPVSMDLIAECPDSFPETLELPGRGAAVLRLHGLPPGWYGSIPLKISNQHLADGLTLRTVGFALVLQGSLLHVLGQDPNVGGWSSVRQVDPMEEHMLVVHETMTGAVRAFLDEYANQGWSNMVRQVEGLPLGWQIYQGVRVERPGSGGRGFLSVLVPSLRSRACLWGGLPIGQLKATYLTGGEPAVLIPTEGEEVRAVFLVAAPAQVGGGGGRASSRRR